MATKTSRPLRIVDWYYFDYLLLSFLSGLLELGVVVYAFRQNMPLVAIPLLGLAYQAGALFRRPFELSARHYAVAALSGLALALVVGHYIVGLILSVFFLSIALQGIRDLALKNTEAGTFIKRVSRVAGFIFSGFFDPSLLVVVASVILATLFFGWKTLAGMRPTRDRDNWHPGPLGLTMLVHQSHYFTYACFIPFLFLRVHSVQLSFIGIIFSIGWISYSVAPFVFAKQPRLKVFSFGHVLAFFTLVTIFCFSQNLGLVILAWFLSGFGGGTVFCLRELASKVLEDRPDLDLWENLGHVLGLVVSLLVISISANPIYVFLIAAIIALLTAILLPLTVWRGTLEGA